MSDLPDYWSVALNYIKTVELIKLIERIKLIDEITKIGTINQINPTATENVVIDRIAKIGTIDKINPTDVENVVINRIDKLALIDEIKKIATIEKAYLEPQWAAAAGYDTIQGGCAVLAASGSLETVVEYVVPTGKTLMIYDWSGVIYTADGQIYGDLRNVTDGITIARSGGSRGFSQSFFKPLLLTEGKTIRLRLRQDTGAAQTICGHFGGSLT